MPTYRKLHTKTVESLDLNDMPDDFTRLLWVLLPLALCREGRGLDNPSWIRAKIFPLRQDVTQEQIEAAFDWYADRGMIRRYVVESRAYFYVPTFHKYQGTTAKEADTDYPAPPVVQVDSRPTPDLLPTNSGVCQTVAAADPSASASESNIASASEQELVPSAAIDTWVKVRGGAVNPLDVDQINDLIDTADKHRANLPRGSPGAGLTGDQWVRDAILEANSAKKGNGVSFKYVSAILTRWLAEGYRSARGGISTDRFQEAQPWGT
jgi:hypothetical protein